MVASKQKKKEERDWQVDEERKVRLEKMVATAQLLLTQTNGVVNVG